MNLDELLDEEEKEVLDEAIHIRADDYPRYWHHFTSEEKEQYTKEGHKPKSGIWIYKHREALGLDYHDKRIVHHKDKNKSKYDKNNLVALTRAEHCKIEPNRKIYNDNETCKEKGCGNPIYSHFLCFRHYMAHYRKGEFGHYNPSKNKSKKDRPKKSK